jgi:two-component system sensor histidine kinase/response regulator
MDMQMPEMDGLTATRVLRADPRSAGIPIIAMTAHVLDGDRAAATTAGMNGYVTKPLSIELLFSALIEWIPPLPERGAADSALAHREPAADTGTGPADTAPVCPLPDVPGVDARLGVARTGANPERYLDLLRQFAASQADSLDRVVAAVASGDTELAVRTAHTLRGTAGMLGADGLLRAAGELETALANGEEGWRDHLEESRAKLDPIVDAVLARSQGAPPAPETARTGPAPLDRGLLDLLAVQVEGCDSAALDTISRMRATLGSGAPAALGVIEQHLRQFAFGEAGAEIPALRAALHHVAR